MILERRKNRKRTKLKKLCDYRNQKGFEKEVQMQSFPRICFATKLFHIRLHLITCFKGILKYLLRLMNIIIAASIHAYREGFRLTPGTGWPTGGPWSRWCWPTTWRATWSSGTRSGTFRNGTCHCSGRPPAWLSVRISLRVQNDQSVPTEWANSRDDSSSVAKVRSRFGWTNFFQFPKNERLVFAKKMYPLCFSYRCVSNTSSSLGSWVR